MSHLSKYQGRKGHGAASDEGGGISLTHSPDKWPKSNPTTGGVQGTDDIPITVTNSFTEGCARKGILAKGGGKHAVALHIRHKWEKSWAMRDSAGGGMIMARHGSQEWVESSLSTPNDRQPHFSMQSNTISHTYHRVSFAATFS